MWHGYPMAVVALAGTMWLGAGRARAQGMDYPTFHGGQSLSPEFSCLMWSPAGAPGFSGTDEANIEGYLAGLAGYMSNAAAPAGGSAAGTEPTLRQYNVWGAAFRSSCVQDNSSQGSIDDTAVLSEVTYAQQNLGLAPYSATNLTVVFVKGAHYSGTLPCAEHFTLQSGYVVVVYPDMCTDDPRVAASREIFNMAANPYNGFYNEENANQIPTNCPQVGHRGVSDDGVIGTIAFPAPPADGFNQAYTVDDDIDQLTGNYDNCGTLKGGTLFTKVTTTPAVVFAQRRDKSTYLDAIARTPTGLVHMVSTNGGVSFRQVSPAPVGQVTELPAVYSPDGRTLQMYGRGTDGALYHWAYNGTAWSGPDWVGGYLIGPPSAAFASINGVKTNAVFMLGTNGQIAVYSNSNWFWAQMPQYVLAVTPPQVFARSSTCLDVYFTGNDGKMYMDPCWTGNWHTVPGAYGLLTPVTRGARVDLFGRPPIDQSGATPYWLEYNSGTLTNSGYLSQLPRSSGVIAAVGLAGTVTKLFYTLGNYIYATKSDSTGTLFNNWNQFDQVAVTSPPSAVSPDGTVIVMVDRRQSDGHLVEWRFDGTSWSSATDLGVSIM